jgi:hypothetical protein
MGRAGRWMSTSGCDVFPSGRKREPCAVSPISEFRGNPNNGFGVKQSTNSPASS